MNTFFISRKDFLSQAATVVTVVALLLSVVAPLGVFATSASYSIFINTINGDPPSTACLASPVTITGSGHVSHGGGIGASQYRVQLIFSNGVATTTYNGIPITASNVTDGGKTFDYSYSTTTLASAVTANTIKARIYHGGVPGNDGQAEDRK